ncbi:hypothetical protein [Cohnella rhizosphaerae]|uniref:Uncharacterized protein n=1 Tax=Cohnella rhizosphaerae TaxID=1457232 RepID=A0A9X4KQP6_9BACL|nr:hypothetical protein [Cohnella rhizosphaerae]MDG0809060.1 hypothetical protein [Cohnella rhizosphaerae]
MLGLVLKLVERSTAKPVYTLLLNVDYVPVLNRISMPERVEFAIHLAISVALGLCLSWWMNRTGVAPGRMTRYATFVGLAVGLCLYPTSALSDRTPILTDGSAFLYWMAAHALYGATLGALLARTARR